VHRHKPRRHVRDVARNRRYGATADRGGDGTSTTDRSVAAAIRRASFIAGTCGLALHVSLVPVQAVFTDAHRLAARRVPGRVPRAP
jgi:hypothetical protein